jgi:hypothetical protein
MQVIIAKCHRTHVMINCLLIVPYRTQKIIKIFTQYRSTPFSAIEVSPTKPLLQLLPTIKASAVCTIVESAFNSFMGTLPAKSISFVAAAVALAVSQSLMRPLIQITVQHIIERLLNVSLFLLCASGCCLGASQLCLVISC